MVPPVLGMLMGCLPFAGVWTLTPGVRGVFMGEKMSARSCGAGDEGGDESSVHAGNLEVTLRGVGAPRCAVRGVKAPVGLYLRGLMMGVACTRYVLSSTRCSSGSWFVYDCCFVAVGCIKGEESKPLISGSAWPLPGVLGSSLGVFVSPKLGWNSDLSAS